jgi:hypothetical protein
MGSFLMGSYMDTDNAVVTLVASSSVQLAALFLSWDRLVRLYTHELCNEVVASNE